MEPYTVVYAQAVVDFLLNEVTSKRVYERIDRYRTILASFPDLGALYDPVYEAARPPFPCRAIAVPDTPFTLHYAVDEQLRRVSVFAIEHWRINPQTRFEA